MATVEVVGVNGTRGGWIAVRLIDGRFAEARFFRGFKDLLQQFPTAAVVAVDIPIGLPSRGRRRADEAARCVLGPRWRSVFFVPPRPALETSVFEEAVRIAKSMNSSLSKQGYALRDRILEVDRANGYQC